MVEDLKRYAEALGRQGYDEGAEALKDVAESLYSKGKIPAKLDGVKIAISHSLIPPKESTPTVLTDQLAQRMRRITGTLDDSFEIINLLSRAQLERRIERLEHVLGHSISTAPPSNWPMFLKTLTHDEGSQLGRALSSCYHDRESEISMRRLHGPMILTNAGTIRRLNLDELKTRFGIRSTTAKFIKVAFEAQTLRLFDS